MAQRSETEGNYTLTTLLIQHEYILNRRSGLAREEAHSKAFAGKPAPTMCHVQFVPNQ